MIAVAIDKLSGEIQDTPKNLLSLDVRQSPARVNIPWISKIMIFQSGTVIRAVEGLGRVDLNVDAHLPR